MQGDLPLARAYYEEAGEALGKAGDKEGAQHCLEVMERLPSGGQPLSSRAGARGDNAGSNGGSFGGFVEDADGLDSDDDLGEDGLVE